MLATPELMREAAQPARLSEVLPRWLSEVPLYRQRNGAVGPAAAPEAALEAWRRLPLITKQDIRRNFPRNFLRPGVDLDVLLEQELVELEHTSGTSEERTPLLLGQGWWDAQEERALRLNRFAAGVLDASPAARRLTINSPVCSGEICYTGVPARSDRIVGRALFVNLSRHPFLWSAADLARMGREALEWQPQFLDVDPVYGALFARYCEREGLRLPSLRFILSSYEFVSAAHRRILERVFGVPVFNLYGSTETGHLLMENEYGEMAPSLDTALLEVLPPGQPSRPAQAAAEHPQPGGHGFAMGSSMLQGFPALPSAFDANPPPGELVVTTLTNDYMPLLRYRIGDLVERRDKPYATRYVVHGRAADAVARPDGSRVTTLQIDQCLADTPGLLHYQLRPQGDGSWLFRFVPDTRPPGPADLAEVGHRLTHLLGLSTAVAVQETNVLMPESSGKFRLLYPAPSHPERQAGRNSRD